MTRLFNNSVSFRKRLLGIVSLGIIGLAITASLTTAWVTSNRAAAQMVAQALQITGNLAEQSVLALLYESKENADKPLQTIMSFPDVDRAAILDARADALLVMGAKTVSLPRGFEAPGASHPRLVDETTTAWHFVAPVLANMTVDTEEDPYAQPQAETLQKELLGYAYMVMKKGTLRAMQLNIVVNNIGIALSFALIIVWLLNLGIKRLTRPLYQLMDVMREAEQEGSYVYADLDGPIEIKHMAGVFNRMIASLEERDQHLRQHRKTLQTEVAIRTQELVLARDAALSASRHKSEFLANMSHELRTPLQAIIGYSDVVKEELELEGLDENAEALEKVITNAHRLLSQINSILDLAKIEAGCMDLNLETIQLSALLKEATDTVRPMVWQNNNRLEVDIRNEEMWFNADKEKLLQIMLNLLSNASKFTSDGTVTLRAVLEQKLLTISVTDTGIGLEPEQQKVVFEEFRQVDGSATRDFEGTGLGLAITRRFCHLMGGGIEVESFPGEGSTFTVRLPLPIPEPIHATEGPGEDAAFFMTGGN